MTFNEFVEKAKAYVKEVHPEKEVEVKEINKLNKSYTGLIIKGNSPVAPSIDLEELFEFAKEDGIVVALSQITEIINDIPEEVESINVEDVTDYMKIITKIYPRLSNANINEGALSDAPYRMVADLVVTYYINLGNDMTAKITNDLMNVYGVSEEDLYREACKNAATKYTVKSLMETLGFPPEPNDPIVVSNTDNVYGAAMIILPEVQKLVREKIGGDCYILPSSIHELLCVPVKDNDPEGLKDMVTEINNLEVKPEERLSYNIYKFTEEKGIEVVC